MEIVKYFAFDKVNDMVYYMNKFEQTFQFVVVLLIVYTLIKIFMLLDK